MNANELTQAERAAAWESGREERAQVREQAFIDRVSLSIASTLERLVRQYPIVAVAEPSPCDALPPDNVLTRDILARAVAGPLLLGGARVEDMTTLRDFILWEPLGRGVGFDLPGFARWAERKAEK